MTRRLELARESEQSLSIRQKCGLLGVNRSTIYYRAKPSSDPHMATHMNDIQDIYARHPFKGYKRICDDLRDLGHVINHKRVYRLMKLMGLQAIYPKKNLSKRRQQDAIRPYLLRDYPPQKPHDCWCVDITYITASGSVYPKFRKSPKNKRGKGEIYARQKLYKKAVCNKKKLWLL